MSGPFQHEKAVLEKNVEHSPSPPLSEQDVAAAYGLDEKHILRKLDRHLLPGVCVLYLLSFLDRSNGQSLRGKKAYRTVQSCPGLHQAVLLRGSV